MSDFFFTMNQPIGIFDSGIGGLSLLPAIKQLLPKERICYIADESFSPYGEKNLDVLIQRSRKITQHLIDLDCKLILLACNTATTQVINTLRKEFELPFVGIEPGVKPAALASKTGVVGVLATQGTLKSDLFKASVALHASSIKLLKQVGHGLVECIEERKNNTPETRALLKQFIDPMVAQGMDVLLLGCTHYPFLLPQLNELLPDEVEVLDNSYAIAQQIDRLLKNNNLLQNKEPLDKDQYFSTLKHNRLQHFINQEVYFLPI